MDRSPGATRTRRQRAAIPDGCGSGSGRPRPDRGACVMTFGGLEVMLVAPFAGAIAAIVMRDRKQAAWAGLGVSTVVLAWSIGVWIDVVNGSAGYHAESDGSWIEPIGVRWHLGVDSLSAPLVVLTALLTWCCMVALLRRAPNCGGR